MTASSFSNERETARPSSLRGRTIALGALWLTVSGGALAAPACYPRNCDSGVETFGTKPGEGQMVTEDVWESTGQQDHWLWFPGQRTWVFDVSALGNRTPYETTVYMSAQEEPNRTGNHTEAGGNIALLSAVGPNRVNVTNDSCSDFYLRLVLKVRPFPPAATIDAGPIAATPETDAGTNDAGEDADGGDAGL